MVIQTLQTVDQVTYEHRFGRVIGKSPALKAVLEQVEPVGSLVPPCECREAPIHLAAIPSERRAIAIAWPK